MIKIAVFLMVLGTALAGDLLFGSDLALPVHPIRSLGYYGYPIRTLGLPGISSGYRDISSGYRDISSGFRDVSSGFTDISPGYFGSFGLINPFYRTLI
ncbi:hypothetical protein X975_03958, partial [Stegodyphus mimosarum]